MVSRKRQPRGLMKEGHFGLHCLDWCRVKEHPGLSVPKAMHHKSYGLSNGVCLKSAEIIDESLCMFSDCALASNTG